MQTPSQGGLPLETLIAQITEQANLVRSKKEQGAGEDELQPLITTLMQLKVDLTDQVGVGGHDLALTKSAYKKEKKHLEEAKTVKKEKQQFKEGEGRNAKLAKKMLEEREKAQLVNNTPPGEKKDVSDEMAKAYEPASVESAWYSWWEKCGFFRPRDDDESSERFVIVIPPPNVTGSLHLGHALTCSIQDSLVRWHRMLGHNTLYVPGTDHAGIATQVVVEKQLKKESGVTRHQLGREEFLKKVWEWKEARGGHITKQQRLTGASVDWTREAFTMDEKRSAAVKEAFCRLYERGLIYRDTKLTDWSCALQSVISKIEIENIELTGETKLNVPGYEKKIEFGFLFDFAYPIDGVEGEYIVVSTTRPETMLGDTAVAIHPDDPRYKHLHGKYVKHPFVDRKFPIICDSTLVDMSFGTGAVKVTPAHDPNDFACGKRHNLEVIDIMTDAGLLNSNCGEFSGMKRFDARTAVMKKLEEMKLFRGRKPNAMTIPTCSRTGDVLEPRVKPQWYCDCKNMAQRSVKAVENGELRILPKSHETVWYHWLNNIQDWCISRQLWWGHRIPAYYVDFEGEPKGERNINERWVVGRTEEEARASAAKRFNKDPNSIILSQDEDVLDTWFSSALFPFSTMGWPEQTNDLKMFYPGQLLETGYDILFFWVARMVMFGLELTDQLPFKDVFLHTIVRDKYGRKMSKSLGNVIDPLWVVDGITLPELHSNVASGNLDPREVSSAQKAQTDQFSEGIAPCGSDGLRFSLLNNTTQGADINLDINGVVSCRNFCNKIWQATRMAMAHLTEFTPATTPMGGYEATPLVVKWILSRLNHAIAEVNESFKNYDFHQVTVATRVFFWEELCDVFLEFSKPILHEPNHPYLAATREALYTCLEVSFRLLHPTLPFLTEELWQRLPKRPDEKAVSIMISKYPQPVPQWNNPQAELNMELVLQVARAMRSTKVSYQLAPKSAPKSIVRVRTEEQRVLVLDHTIDFQRNCGVGEVESVIGGEAPKGYGMTTATPDIDVFLALAGNVDAAAEIAKLEKEIIKLAAQRDKINAERADTVKYEKKPEAKRKDDLEKLEKLEQEIIQKNKDIETFKSLAQSIGKQMA